MNCTEYDIYEKETIDNIVKNLRLNINDANHKVIYVELCNYLCEYGYLNLLQKLIKDSGDILHSELNCNYNSMSTFLSKAINGGDLETIAWLYETYWPLLANPFLKNSDILFNQALIFDYQGIIEYFLNKEHIEITEETLQKLYVNSNYYNSYTTEIIESKIKTKICKSHCIRPITTVSYYNLIPIDDNDIVRDLDLAFKQPTVDTVRAVMNKTFPQFIIRKRERITRKFIKKDEHNNYTISLSYERPSVIQTNMSSLKRIVNYNTDILNNNKNILEELINEVESVSNIIQTASALPSIVKGQLAEYIKTSKSEIDNVKQKLINKINTKNNEFYDRFCKIPTDIDVLSICINKTGDDFRKLNKKMDDKIIELERMCTLNKYIFGLLIIVIIYLYIM